MTQRPFRIFLSYKFEDHELAERVAKALRGCSKDVEVFVAETSIEYGANFRDEIKTALQDSNMLILLFTQPTRAWDWCLFETGMFTGLGPESTRRRVVSFYSVGGEPPAPTSDLRGVAASEDELYRFLRKELPSLDGGGETSDDDSRREASLRNAAQEIAVEFQESCTQRHYASYRLHLTIPADVELPDNVIPPESTAKCSDPKALDVFGLAPGEHTWEELIERVSTPTGEACFSELGRAFADASRRRVHPPIVATFRSHDGDRILRPQLYRVDVKADRPVAAVVVFHERRAPGKVGSDAFNLVRANERLRAEVFEVYAGGLEREIARCGPERTFKRLAACLEDILREAEVLKTFDNLEAVYGSDYAAHSIEAKGERFTELLTQLQAAIGDCDAEVAEQKMEDLNELNHEFSLLSTRRYLATLE